MKLGVSEKVNASEQKRGESFKPIDFKKFLQAFGIIGIVGLFICALLLGPAMIYFAARIARVENASFHSAFFAALGMTFLNRLYAMVFSDFLFVGYPPKVVLCVDLLALVLIPTFVIKGCFKTSFL